MSCVPQIHTGSRGSFASVGSHRVAASLIRRLLTRRRDARPCEDVAMEHRAVETWLTDMDGVLVHEEVPIPGAQEFIEALKASGLDFLVLTNNSIFTPRDLRARLLRQRHRRARGVDLDLRPGHRPVPARPAARRHGVRRGGGGADHGAARHRLRDDRPRPRLRGAGGDPHLLLRGDHPGDPADRRRRAVHRDQPRRQRPQPAGQAAGLRLGGRADQHRDGARSPTSSASPTR